MVSSVPAGMMAQEKEKKKQTRLAEEKLVEEKRILKLIKDDMESSFIPVDIFNNKNQKVEEEVIENVEPKAEQSAKEDKPKKTGKAKKQGKNNNKVLKDS